MRRASARCRSASSNFWAAKFCAAAFHARCCRAATTSSVPSAKSFSASETDCTDSPSLSNSSAASLINFVFSAVVVSLLYSYSRFLSKTIFSPKLSLVSFISATIFLSALPKDIMPFSAENRPFTKLIISLPNVDSNVSTTTKIVFQDSKDRSSRRPTLIYDCWAIPLAANILFCSRIAAFCARIKLIWSTSIGILLDIPKKKVFQPTAKAGSSRTTCAAEKPKPSNALE